MTRRSGPSHGLKDQMLEPMIDYVITNFYPSIVESFPNDKTMQVQVMYEELVKSTAKMVALW